MKKEFERKERIADLLQQEIAQIIQRELKDPRIGLVTIATVAVSRDLKNAKIYFTVLPDELDKNQVAKTLNAAVGYIRKMLAEKSRLRTVPQIKFYYDEILDKGNRLTNLINQAFKDDNKPKKSEE